MIEKLWLIALVLNVLINIFLTKNYLCAGAWFVAILALFHTPTF